MVSIILTLLLGIGSGLVYGIYSTRAKQQLFELQTGAHSFIYFRTYLLPLLILIFLGTIALKHLSIDPILFFVSFVISIVMSTTWAISCYE